MPIDELDSAYDLAAAGADANPLGDDDDTSDVADKPEDDEDSEQRPTKSSDDEDDDDGEKAEEDEADPEDPDASEDKPDSDKNGDDLAFDKGIYDALKNKPELVQTLKGYEENRREITKKITDAELVMFDAPPEHFKGAFQVMAEARGLTIEEFASQIVGKPFSDAPAAKPGAEGGSENGLDPKDPRPTEPNYDNWEEEGFDSRGEMRIMYRQDLSDWQRREDKREAAAEKAKAERVQTEAAQRQQQDQKLEAQSKTVAQRVKAETGWDVAPAKVLKALKDFPGKDPVHAVKAAYPDDYANFKAGIKGKVKTPPTTPKTGGRNPETRVTESESPEDHYDRVARLNS